MIRTVLIYHSRYAYATSSEPQECIVLRRQDRDSNIIDMAFPFLEDTPNIQLSFADALTLRNAIDDLVSIKLIERTGGHTE